jgi:hypothetical protein
MVVIVVLYAAATMLRSAYLQRRSAQIVVGAGTGRER